MEINKIVYNNQTLIDLTNDTITADKLLFGYTAHDKAGNPIVGVAAGERTMVSTIDQLKDNWNSQLGFILSYDNITTGITYITNIITASTGTLGESTNEADAAAWHLEKVSGYTDRFNIYTILDDTNQYIYNNTTAGANFIGLSPTSKTTFIISQVTDINKFYLKLSSANKWLQHSNSGKGIRLYTDNNNANNTQFFFTYKVNAIVPYGTLTITENGTYDVSLYKNIIVNV